MIKKDINPNISHLKYIAIDEISIKKWHTYIALIMDLQSGAVVFVGEGKGADALDPFWKKLRRSRAKIKAVAMDMSIAYISAVLKNLPGVPLVFDHFHVVNAHRVTGESGEARNELVVLQCCQIAQSCKEPAVPNGTLRERRV